MEYHDKDKNLLKEKEQQESCSRDIPEILPLFPLASSLLLPRIRVPFDLSEKPLIDMFNYALSTHRMIVLARPFSAELTSFSRTSGIDSPKTDLCSVGSIGRLVAFEEQSPKRYLITLEGVTRCLIREELLTPHCFRLVKVDPSSFSYDLSENREDEKINRDSLIRNLSLYFHSSGFEIDWDDFAYLPNTVLVNTLCALSSVSSLEKQTLLEAKTLQERLSYLIRFVQGNLLKSERSEMTLQ